jgi:hypothetical protein
MNPACRLPSPLYRWKSFWLGILVLAFLIWAWGISVGRFDGLLYRHSSWWIVAGQNTGFVVLKYYSTPLGGTGLDWIHESPGDAFSEYRLRPMVPDLKDGRVGMAIAHWLLIVLFLVPWSAFLFRRHRRMKCVAEGA